MYNGAPMKRRIVHAAICLILGVVTTVGVAWGLAWFVAYDMLPQSTVHYAGPVPDDGDPFVITRRTAFGSDRATAMRQRAVREEPATDLVGVFAPESAMPALIADRVTLAQSERQRLIREGDARDVIPTQITEDLRGWPLRALVVYWDGGLAYLPNAMPYAGDNAAPGGFPLAGISLAPYQPDDPGTRSLDSQRALPLRPIFPGFIINTLFYAAIWFGVLFLPGIAKRAIRRKRGRCVKCGYDLRGHRPQDPHPDSTDLVAGQPLSRRERGVAGCPECGWGRADR